MADRRLRVKGRFVKRSEQEQLKQQLLLQEEEQQQQQQQKDDTHQVEFAVTVAAAPSADEGTAMGIPAVAAPSSTSAGESGTATTTVSDATVDQDMPDVSDPDAGFEPTDDQPYRRLRRHTIT